MNSALSLFFVRQALSIIPYGQPLGETMLQDVVGTHDKPSQARHYTAVEHMSNGTRDKICNVVNVVNVYGLGVSVRCRDGWWSK